MQSANPVLTTVFPTPRELTLSGQIVRVGKLKQRQKAELQDYLDRLPEPNGRVRAALEADATARNYPYVWPLSLDKIALLLDLDYQARYTFLRIALRPFNLGLSDEQITALADDCDNDDEVLAILFAAFGVDPNAAKAAPEPEPIDPKKDDPAQGLIGLAF